MLKRNAKSLLLIAALGIALTSFLSILFVSQGRAQPAGADWAYGWMSGPDRLIISSNGPCDDRPGSSLPGCLRPGTEIYTYQTDTVYDFLKGGTGGTGEQIRVKQGEPSSGQWNDGDHFSNISIRQTELFDEYFSLYGDPGAGGPKSGDVGVKVLATYTGNNVGNSVGPDTLTLRRNSCNGRALQTTQTDTQSYNDVPNPITLNGSFSNIQPRNYGVHSKLLDKCKEFEVNGDTFVTIKGKIDQATLEKFTDRDDVPECQGGALGWIICPVISFVQGVVDFAKDSIIIPFLETKPLVAGDNPVHNSWRNFRNLANVLLIPVFFVIIFSQALSLNIDAYTIKKILPKLVAATILIQFSFFIAAALVDLTNVLGNGLGQLVIGSFTGTNIADVNAAGPSAFLQGLTIAGLVVAGFAAVFSGLVFALIIPLFLAVIAVILTLVFRQLIIILAAVLAPLAFAAWILPNTEKLFKLWWDSFLKALMMYPIIVLLFSIGSIAAQVLVGETEFIPGEGVGTEAIRDVAALAAVIAPLALVPFAFKFGGTGLGTIAGGINKFRAQGTGKLKEARGKPPKPGSLRERTQQYRQRTAVGVTGLSKIPGAKMMARPGTGITGGSKSRAIMEFNTSKADAKKNLEAQGFNDGRVLAHFAEVAHDQGAYRKRIRDLKATGQEDKVQIAQQLESMAAYRGRTDVQAAALETAAEQGRASRESFGGVATALKGNRAVQAQAIGSAAFAGRERTPEVMGYKLDSSGRIAEDPKALVGYLASAGNEEAVGKIRNWDKIAPHMETIITGGGEHANQMVGNLRRALGSGATSAESKVQIKRLIEDVNARHGLKIPTEPPSFLSGSQDFMNR